MVESLLIMFGTTETYDPSYDYSWVDNLKEGNVILTKNLSDKMIETLIQHKDKCILHLTVTGMGGTVIEPGAPTKEQIRKQFDKLVKHFPIEQTVLRISPIVPTHKGTRTTLSALDTFQGTNIPRVRYSTLNMYPHVKERFRANRIPFPYTTYSCPIEMRRELNLALCDYFKAKDTTTLRDVCIEIDTETRVMHEVGCISKRDMDILGITLPTEATGRQRSCCICADIKRNIIRRAPQQCPIGCLYCYEPDEPKQTNKRK